MVDLIVTYAPMALFLAAVGGLTGFFSGLLGIGGGLILVPGLYFGLGTMGYDGPHLMHLAVGTSLAAILPTGLSSAWTYWHRGSVNWGLAAYLAPGALIGSLAGVCVAGTVDASVLRTVFGMAIIAVALLMFTDTARYPTLKAGAWLIGAGALVGLLSALMGLGGTLLLVPLLVAVGVRMQTTIGTGATVNPAITIPGVLGFILIGWGADTGVPGSVGYVNLIAWALIVPFSVAAVPLGAHLSHTLPTERLRRLFALFMFLIAGRMLWGA